MNERVARKPRPFPFSLPADSWGVRLVGLVRFHWMSFVEEGVLRDDWVWTIKSPPKLGPWGEA